MSEQTDAICEALALLESMIEWHEKRVPPGTTARADMRIHRIILDRARTVLQKAGHIR